mgnify:CR=1 FL=1
MDPIYVPHLLKARDRTRTFDIETVFPELKTLTPVRGSVQVKHCTTYLEVQGKAETIVTLTCDRCLQHYNHRLTVDAEELIWLEDPTEWGDEELLEREVSAEDLVENLAPDGHFEPETWLYEQVCLALPQRQICDEACAGIPVDVQQETANPLRDRRWAALAKLKHQLAPEDA